MASNFSQQLARWSGFSLFRPCNLCTDG